MAVKLAVVPASPSSTVSVTVPEPVRVVVPVMARPEPISPTVIVLLVAMVPIAIDEVTALAATYWVTSAVPTMFLAASVAGAVVGATRMMTVPDEPLTRLPLVVMVQSPLALVVVVPLYTVVVSVLLRMVMVRPVLASSLPP